MLRLLGDGCLASCAAFRAGEFSRGLAQVVSTLGALPRFKTQAAADGLNDGGCCGDEGEGKERDLNVACGQPERMQSQRDIHRAKVPIELCAYTLAVDREISAQHHLRVAEVRPVCGGLPTECHAAAGDHRTAIRRSVVALPVQHKPKTGYADGGEKHREGQAAHPHLAPKTAPP